METISSLMKQEHERLFKILDESISLISKDTSKAEEVFFKFKWNMEKHLFTEEKAIFNSEIMVGETVSDMFNLLRAHGEIINLIKNVEEDFSSDSSNLLKLKDFCLNHEKIENEVFYPKLDEELSPEMRKEIIDKINEIVVG